MSGFVLRGRSGDVAVRDGRIAAEADGLPVIDAGELWIGPGFIDSHTHPLSWSRQLAHTSLAHVRSIPEALAAAMTRLIAEPGLRETLGSHSRTLAEHFTWPSIAAAHEHVYNALLERRIVDE